MNNDRTWISLLTPVVEKFVEELLPKAVRWCLVVCCSAMVLSCLTKILLDPARFEGPESLPMALFYFTMVGTMFTLFYAALALVLIAVYHRYKHMPAWPSVKKGTLIWIATALLAAVLVSSQVWYRV